LAVVEKFSGRAKESKPAVKFLHGHLSKTRGAQAFTFVVIANIATQAAMLLRALGSAKSSARRGEISKGQSSSPANRSKTIPKLFQKLRIGRILRWF
jgi:hypothetical protein